MTALIPIAVAAVGLAGALLIHYLTQRSVVLDRKREVSAQALADVLSWIELPYRVRRRVNDEPATISALAERAHKLQESMLFHACWLQVEIPEAYADYRDLVSAVKVAVGPALEEAWKAPPASGPSAQNLGNGVAIDRSDVDRRIEDLGMCLRNQLSLWRVSRT